MDINRRLVIRSGGEHLLPGSRNGGVAVDDAGEHTAQGFNAQRQRGYIQQQYVFYFACQYAGLNGSADGNAFVRVNVAGRLFAHHPFDSFLYSRDTGRTANQNYFVDIAGGQACVAQCPFGGSNGPFYQIRRHFFEFGAGQVHVQMFRAVSASRDERQVDVGGHHAGQFDLGLFRCFTQTLHGHLVVGQVDAAFFLEFRNHPVHDAVVEVVAAQMGIAVGGFYFEYAVAQFQDADIEGAAAQVIHQDGMVVGLVDAVSQGSRRRFVDDTQNFQTRNLACIFGSLTLGIGEVSRNGDDRLGYGFSQIFFRVRFQLLQNHGGDFFRGEFLVADLHTVTGFAHMPFNGAYGTGRVGNRLTFCHLADQTLVVFRETDYRRSQAAAFRVRDNGGFATFHYCNNRVRST